MGDWYDSQILGLLPGGKREEPHSLSRSSSHAHVRAIFASKF